MRTSRPLVAKILSVALLLGLAAPVTSAYAETAKKPTTVAAATSTVNINTASAEQLAQALNGVGLKKAQAIIDYRAKHGKFIAIDQLAEVKGIGAATIEKNRTKISL